MQQLRPLRLRLDKSKSILDRPVSLAEVEPVERPVAGNQNLILQLKPTSWLVAVQAERLNQV